MLLTNCWNNLDRTSFTAATSLNAVPVPSRNLTLRRDLTCSTYEGGCYSGMVGLSETYFAAYYIAVGMSEFSVGLLASLPYLLGSLLQLSTPWGVRWLGSYRLWTIGTSTLQGLSLLLLAWATWQGQTHFLGLMTIATLYWASGLATGPAWNTWIESIVPSKIRARYFSNRMRICQLCLLSAIALAGLSLRAAAAWDSLLVVFTGLFVIAGMLRLLSSRSLSRQAERPEWVRQNLYAETLETSDASLTSPLRSTLPFFAAMQFAVYISGPFFAPFMLKNLGLSYLQYMQLILLGYTGRVLMLPTAGNFAKKFGPQRLLWWGAWGIVPLSALWCCSNSFAMLCCVQILSGAAWACYELAMSLVLIEQIPARQRMRVLSWYNTFNGVAMVLGSVLGGLLIRYGGQTNQIFLFVFALSGVARIGALYWFPRDLLSQPTAMATRWWSILPWQLGAPSLNGRTLWRPFFVVAPSASVSKVRGNRKLRTEPSFPRRGILGPLSDNSSTGGSATPASSLRLIATPTMTGREPLDMPHFSGSSRLSRDVSSTECPNGTGPCQRELPSGDRELPELAELDWEDHADGLVTGRLRAPSCPLPRAAAAVLAANQVLPALELPTPHSTLEGIDASVASPPV